MFSTFKWKKAVGVTLAVLGSLALLATIERQRSIRRCQRIVVRIDDGQPTQRLITADDVRRLVTSSEAGPVLKQRLDRLDLKALEARVRSNGLVKECQIAADLSGTLTVRVWQHQPIARLIERRGLGNEADGYLNAAGEVLPLSEHYAARVLLVSGPYFDRLPNLTAPRHRALVELLKYIATDAFWNAQIAQVMVERDGDVSLLPQVGNHLIGFGAATEPEAKFRKLKIFYKQIIPSKGWNAYSRVSVRFRNQLVCEPAALPAKTNPPNL
ncbi:MAG: hypothetical protein H7Y12_03395 [Sphingobacteriaceae bacterium]|nr:hypothetical protein [Cytophagaceae bacterium]